MAEHKEDRARKLEEEKERLEEKIGQLLEGHQREEPLDLNIGIDEAPEVSGQDKGEDELIDRIHKMVNEFHGRPIVQSAGVQVQKITALDSDADGRVALDVEYSYSGA